MALLQEIFRKQCTGMFSVWYDLMCMVQGVICLLPSIREGEVMEKKGKEQMLSKSHKVPEAVLTFLLTSY